MRFIRNLIIVLAAGLLPFVLTSAQLPNVLWIVAEDMNPNLGCYGDTNATTPNIDKLANRGLRFTKCWSAAPVCAPARTALISGVYPTATGGEHMRSEVALPSYMRLYPQLLADAGYYCVNKSKEDYNIRPEGKVWAESSPRAHYRNRTPGQPFFAAFNIELTHESQIRSRPHTLKHDPAKIRLPAYHPDAPEVRRDWAQYYDKITEMDQVVGKHLRELDELGLSSETIVFFYGDNGCGMPRSKRWPYNSGLSVPLIVFVPEKWKALAPPGYSPGGVSDRLVNFVDFAPTLLSIAGVEPPSWMQGTPFMGRHTRQAPAFNHGFRGRMDERYDMVRSVTDGRYVYIRNYMPHLVYGQYLEYMFQTPTTRLWKDLYDNRKLEPPQTFFWEPKPPEELYDLATDPDEVRNLAGSPQHAEVLQKLRGAQRAHALAVRDVGFLSEAEMHARASGATIYEMGHAAGYALERIMAMAELASLLKPDALPELRAALKDTDAAVRYWAALGLLMRGNAGVTAARDDLRAALRDPSPSVRVIAARALGQHGNDEDLKLALPVLEAMSSPAENGAYISMMTLNAIDALGAKAAPLLSVIKSMPVKDPAAPARANSYVQRLVSDITREKAAAKRD